MVKNLWVDWAILPAIYRVEWYLLAGLGVTFLLIPRRLRPGRSLARKFDQLAAHHRVAILTVIAAVMIGRAALLPTLPIPHPGIHDEFGFLLTADTFLHGRLTNPTPPLGQHFEMFHVFEVPTYQSQYPFGYPVVMAAAWALVGNPWWGVFVTTALMCGALVWMLQAWLPPRWALLGGLLVAIRIGLFSYWMNSYFGGSLAALGGCLFFGALPRLIPNLGRRNAGQGSAALYSFLGALGLAMLATTRPYEGLVVSLPGIALLLWFLLQRGRDTKALLQILLPGLSVIAVLFASILIYQKAVTGDALKSPYTVMLEQYRIVKPFFFQELLPMHKYRNLDFLRFYVIYEQKYRYAMSDVWGILRVTCDRSEWYWKLFVGPLLTLPLLLVPSRLGVKRLRLVWISLVALGIGIFIESFLNPHYLAPGFSLITLVLLEGLRKLRTVRISAFRMGEHLAAVLPLLCVVMLVIRVAAFDENTHEDIRRWPPNWAFSTVRLPERDRVADIVGRSSGKALIIVRYRAAFHDPLEEWVNNGADLETPKILWARSLSAEQNCELVQHYSDRKLWVVDKWDDVSKRTLEDSRQLCDPKNPIYEVNYPRDHYISPEYMLSKTRSYMKPRQMY